MRIFFATNMVRTSVLAKLRMRKQCTKKTIPLDVVPERRPIFPDHFSKSKTILKIEKNAYQAKAIALQIPNFAHFGNFQIPLIFVILAVFWSRFFA